METTDILLEAIAFHYFDWLYKTEYEAKRKKYPLRTAIGFIEYLTGGDREKALEIFHKWEIENF